MQTFKIPQNARAGVFSDSECNYIPDTKSLIQTDCERFKANEGKSKHFNTELLAINAQTLI